MPKKQLPSIEDWLTNGPGSLRNQLYKWARQEANRPGPWTLYVKVAQGEQKLEEVFREAVVEMDSEDVPEWVDDIRDAIYEKLGVSPTGRVRLVVEAYHDNESKVRTRGVHIDNIAAQHTQPQMQFIQDEFFQNALMQTMAMLMQSHAHIVAQHEATTAMMAEGLHAQSHLATHRGVIESANGMQGITGIINLMGMAAAGPLINELRKGEDSAVVPLLMSAMQNGFGLKQSLTKQAQGIVETNTSAMGLDEMIAQIDYRGWGDDRDPSDIGVIDVQEASEDSPALLTGPVSPSQGFDPNVTAAALEDDPERLLALLQNAGPQAKAYIKANLGKLTPILMGR